MPVTGSDMQEATRVGHAKNDYSQARNHQHYGDKIVPLDQIRKNNILGSLGELKCAQFFGLEFDSSECGIGRVDLKIIEVRARRIEIGRELPIRPSPKDNMRLPFVLVWFDEKRMVATIVGWLCAWEGHQRAMEAKQAAGRDVWWQQAKGVWFIPPPYHSIASLQDWIMVGHPQHWAPEKYRHA